MQHKRKNTMRQRFVALAASIVVALGTVVLLQLIAQYMGKNVSIDSRSLKLSLDVMVIEGRFENLSPENAFELLGKSAGFRWQIGEHKIVVTPLFQAL